MNFRELQMHLALTRRYDGAMDNIYGAGSKAGTRLLFEDGPDTPLTDQDFVDAGRRLKVQPAAIKAFWATESAGVAYQNGMPKILPEPHRFSKLTKGRFDQSHPNLSFSRWNRSWYPAAQSARYEVIYEWVRLLASAGLDVDPAFAAVSYGGPQILGENAKNCWVTDPVRFAEFMAHDERSQLLCFEAFVQNVGILPYLRQVSRNLSTWSPVARLYNGTAYRENKYDEKMLANYIRFGGV